MFVRTIGAWLAHLGNIMPAAKGNSALNVSIDSRVKLAAQRIFAGKPRGKQLSDWMERQLIRKCIAAGERLPEELLFKTKP